MVLAGHRSSAYDIAALAVGELTLAHQQNPNDPLIIFCIGLAFLNSSMQRTVHDRQHSVAKAFAFLQLYQEKRIQQSKNATNSETNTDTASGITPELAEIESWYNIARAHHQLVNLSPLKRN